MHYLIDGYNLFFSLEIHTSPLARKREEFIASLESYVSLLNLRITLIFDSDKQFSECFPSKQVLNHLEVVFSPKGISADDYIVEWLSSKQHRQKIMVVTSDQTLAKQVASMGANTQTTTTFSKWLRKKKQQNLVFEDPKMAYESTEEFHRLLSLFEERLKKNKTSPN